MENHVQIPVKLIFNRPMLARNISESRRIRDGRNIVTRLNADIFSFLNSRHNLSDSFQRGPFSGSGSPDKSVIRECSLFSRCLPRGSEVMNTSVFPENS